MGDHGSCYFQHVSKDKKTKWGNKMGHKEDRSKKFKILGRDKNVINVS